MGKKDTPHAPVQPSVPSTPNTLTSISPAQSPAPAPGSATEHFVSADNLNVRDQPSGKVVSKLKRGEKVQVGFALILLSFGCARRHSWQGKKGVGAFAY